MRAKTGAASDVECNSSIDVPLSLSQRDNSEMSVPENDFASLLNDVLGSCLVSLFPEFDPRMRTKTPIPERQITLNQILGGCAYNEANGCWEWQGAATKQGYGRVKLSRKLYTPHRVVAWAMGIAPAMGDPSRKTCVMHSCDNPKCCNPEHLSFGSHSENMIDCARKGRVANQKGPWKPKPPKPERPAFRYKRPKTSA